jgi:polyhydroxybutyrate depolymerase
MNFVSILLLSSALAADPLAPGDHNRTLQVDGGTRSYIVHVPPKLNSKQPTPVVLAFHGAATNGSIMALSTDLSAKADEAGFIVVYPNGTGKGDMLLFWNAGGWHGTGADKMPDDVKFVRELLNELAKVVKADPKRIYATGMSNGGMMCYRLATELSDRIAAIAPVSGTMAENQCHPLRPVPVMHFHGTQDKLVPFDGPDQREAKVMAFKSVEETIRTWAKIDGCPPKPKITKLAHKGDDGTTVERKTYGPGKGGGEVILFVINGGGHTWPGRKWPVPWLGKTTKDISANDLMWEFFKRHPMPTLKTTGTKTAFKGWELYNWQDKGDTYFSLMEGTNKLKTDEEITKAAVKGIDAIKPRLDELKAGETVSFSGRKLLTEPPKKQAAPLMEYGKKIGLKVQ